ncbi:MAG: hypothetical protein XD50_0779 [Clostridia bacterium 41_269]|nr:MAG: hypothetical protein XD50_0779 [Clostridia bacterium 41_269]
MIFIENLMPDADITQNFLRKGQTCRKAGAQSFGSKAPMGYDCQAANFICTHLYPFISIGSLLLLKEAGLIYVKGV